MSAEEAPASPDGPGWGILATGGIAQLFTKDLLAHGHRVVAVGSRSAEAAAAFAESFGLPRAHGSYEDLVADPEVDIVYVATPHTLHAANTLLALDHGKHVLVEKAFTLNAPEARAVAERAAASGRVVLEALWTRFLPHMQALRETIASGRIGAVRSVHAVHAQHLQVPDTHRLYDRDLGGGALLDLGVYPISFVHDLLGAPVDLSATATFTDTGVDGAVATVGRHAGGALSTTYSSMIEAGHNSASVLGSEGRIEIAATWYASSAFTVHGPDGSVLEEVRPEVSGRGMQHQAREMERLVRDGLTESPLLPLHESVAVMETLDRVREQIGLGYPGE
ncbi:Gfo/Idh/MocA family protein [Brachybacterium sp. YJGR34]|uniref:Gfo/Idh/MocA family protein n=1 Tax=Brachybacterium sp. YJGR34 TaxID=2059911 RepID=UPI000E0AC02F|nr:Gfo/Idh/MocA family oxidoreductase [Brachybacterium sp. YJGR34]